MQQRHEPAIDATGFFPVAAVDGGDECDGFLREGAGEAGNPALCAQHHAFERDVVEAGEDVEAIAELIDEVGEAAGVRGAFLDGLDVGDAFELTKHIDTDVDAVGRRVVVEHDRQRGCLGYGLEVGDQFFRLRHIDHGRQQHQAVGAELFGVASIGDGATGVEFRHAGDDRNAAVDDLDGALEDLALFVRVERVVLAAGAHDDQAVHAVIDQGVLDTAGVFEVDRQVFVELGRYSGNDAAPASGHRNLLGLV